MCSFHRFNMKNARIMSTKTHLAALASTAKGGLVTPGDAAVVWGLTPKLASNRLARLCRAGWVTRVAQGVYQLLPLEAASAQDTSVEDPWLLATVLFEPCYIAGWSACEHWGLTEQLFNSTFVASAASVRSRNQTHGGLRYRIVRVPEARVLSVAPSWRAHHRVRVSDRERTIVDGLTDPAWVGGIRQLADVVESYVGSEHYDTGKLRRALTAHGKGASFKRLGYIAEQLQGPAGELTRVAASGISKGITKLDPDLKSHGPINTRWALVINADLQRGRS